MDRSSLAHSCWECQYHIVFIPKYRKKVMYGKVRDDVREIIRTLCKYKKVEIVAGGGMCRSCTSVRKHSAEAERI